MATNALLSSVVMGGLLLVMLAVVLRLRHWEHPTASLAAGAPTVASRVNGPLGWSIAFVVVTFGLLGLVVGYVAGEPIAGLDPAALGLLLLLVIGVVFLGGGIVSMYSAVRSRGLNSAQAAAVASVVLATLLLLAVVVQLVAGG